MNEESTVLEKLAGRLKWEKGGNGICVEIPAGHDWFVIVGGLASALFAAVSLCVAVLSLIFGQPDTIYWIGALGLLVLESLALSVLVWNFAGKTKLTLDRAEMKITREALGVRFSARKLAIRDIRNLRYLPSSGFRISRSYIPGVMCFEVDEKTYKFASGISDIEAFALIDRMLEVYDFPQDRALEYIGIRR